MYSIWLPVSILSQQTTINTLMPLWTDLFTCSRLWFLCHRCFLHFLLDVSWVGRASIFISRDYLSMERTLRKMNTAMKLNDNSNSHGPRWITRPTLDHMVIHTRSHGAQWITQSTLDLVSPADGGNPSHTHVYFLLIPHTHVYFLLIPHTHVYFLLIPHTHVYFLLIPHTHVYFLLIPHTHVYFLLIPHTHVYFLLIPHTHVYFLLVPHTHVYFLLIPHTWIFSKARKQHFFSVTFL